MSKKSSKKTKTNVAESAATRQICQYCKNHCNNPSFCKTKKQHVGRKQEACDTFKEVK